MRPARLACAVGARCRQAARTDANKLGGAWCETDVANGWAGGWHVVMPARRFGDRLLLFHAMGAASAGTRCKRAPGAGGSCTRTVSLVSPRPIRALAAVPRPAGIMAIEDRKSTHDSRPFSGVAARPTTHGLHHPRPVAARPRWSGDGWLPRACGEQNNVASRCSRA